MKASEIAAIWMPMVPKIGIPKGVRFGDIEGEPTWRNDDNDFLTDEHAAALWRDHATRWLATNVETGDVTFGPAVTGGNDPAHAFDWSIWVHVRKGDDEPTEFNHENLDHALAAACHAMTVQS